MKVPGTICGVVVVFLAGALLGQSVSQREQRGAPRRPVPPVESAQPATPSSSPRRGPGTVTIPEQGYVVAPPSVPAGTAARPLIPSDPLELSYWELYDRERRVTISGKVTRVDWSNPNSYIFLTASGIEWAVESSFIQFRQASVTPAIRVDETITVSGYLPKEELPSPLPARRSPSISGYAKQNHLIRAGEITTVFGQKLSMGQPLSEAETADRLKCTALGC